MQLTEVADRAEVRTVLAYDGQESQVAFAGQCNLAAGKHPHTVRIQQQADHHRRIERWGTTRFVLVGGIEAASTQPGHGIDQQKDQVALGQFGRRAMRLLPIALGLPGTIGFPTAIAHHRSPHVRVTEVAYAGKIIIACHPSHGNSTPTSRMDCFVDSLLVWVFMMLSWMWPSESMAARPTTSKQ